MPTIATKRQTRPRATVATAPQVRALTIEQAEAAQPALAGRLRKWITRADAGDVDYIGLRRAIIRVGRSVFIDEHRLIDFLYQRSAMPPAPARNQGAGKAKAAA
jgi:hypothetical protein